MTSRRGVETSKIRATLIEAAETLLVGEGIGALTAGRLAQLVGLSRPSFHYYFGTIDDLIVALLARRADQLQVEMASLPADANPLRAAWERRRGATGFTFEIMTIGLRRPVVHAALQQHLVALRSLFSRSIVLWFERTGIAPPLDPDAIATTFLALTQAITVDRAMDIDIGHSGLTHAIETWLDGIEPVRPATVTTRC